MINYTIDQIFDLAKVKGIKAKPWSGSRLKVYNGFTHEERVRKWQALNLAIKMGLEKDACGEKCSICGTTGQVAGVAYHSEDYKSMHGHYPLCRSCHVRIHNRFKNPESWSIHIKPYADGTKWFESLHMVDSNSNIPKPDMAAPQGEVANPPKKKLEPNLDFGNRDEMHRIRVEFTKALGLDWSENVNPNTGYKFEWNPKIRQNYLDEAIKLRNQYAALVIETGKGKNILEKMDRNLENCDRNAIWAK